MAAAAEATRVAEEQPLRVSALELEASGKDASPPTRHNAAVSSTRRPSFFLSLSCLLLIAVACLGAALAQQRGAPPIAAAQPASPDPPPCAPDDSVHPCLLRLTWRVTEGFSASLLPPGNASAASFAAATLLVNGGPPPLVDVLAGDLVELTLYNDAPGAPGLAIHWHGLSQAGSPRADGVSRVSTQSLAPGHSCTVRFAAQPPGTHMWHGHAGLTASQGLHGGLLVRRRPAAEARAAAEAWLALSDVWDGASVDQLRARLMRRGRNFSWTGNPSGLAVNGARLPAASAGTRSGAAGELPLPQQMVALQPGGGDVMLYILNACSLSFLWLSFALPPGAQLTLLESSGGLVSPVLVTQVTGLHINAGERLTLRLSNLPPSPSTAYLTLATRHRASPSGGPGPTGAMALTFQGAGAAAAQAAPPPPPSAIAASLAYAPVWNDSAPTAAFYGGLRALRGQVPLPPPPGPGRSVVVLYGSQAYISGYQRWIANNISFAYPDDPVAQAVAAEAAAAAAGGAAASDVPADAEVETSQELLIDLAARAARGNATAQRLVAGWTSLNLSAAAGVAGEEAAAAAGGGAGLSGPRAPSLGTLVVRLGLGEVTDVLLLNGPSTSGVFEQHPWHKHGGEFWVLGEGVGLENAPRAPPAVDPGAPPRQSDMLTLMPRGWAWLRFVADNPGVWPFHCHIAWHLQMGMLVLFVVAPEQIPLQ